MRTCVFLPIHVHACRPHVVGGEQTPKRNSIRNEGRARVALFRYVVTPDLPATLGVVRRSVRNILEEGRCATMVTRAPAPRYKLVLRKGGPQTALQPELDFACSCSVALLQPQVRLLSAQIAFFHM